MNFEPKVSIVIPVYNGANYLSQAIESALGQSYPNIEVLVVNDGSNDNGETARIASSYGNRIRYFYKENGGVASALNLGISKMTGEWFAWLSHDDLFSTNRIEQDIRIVTAHSNVLITYSKLAIINAKGDLVKEIILPLQKVTNPWDVLLLGGVSMCSMTIHRSCFEKVGLFNEANHTTQDVEMTLSLSKHYEFWLNNQSTSYSRVHPEQGTNTKTDQHKKDSILLANFIRNNFTFHDFFPDLNENDSNKSGGAWRGLGDFYSFLGANEYANECYKKISFKFKISHFLRRAVNKIKRLFLRPPEL